MYIDIPDFLSTGLQAHDSLLGQPLPSTISIETTNFCNLKCTHCGHSKYPPFRKGHADIELLDRLNPYLGGGRIGALALNESGEPFVATHWRRFLQLAKNIEGLQIAYITNGLLIHKHLDDLIHPRINLSVSVDGATEATYEHFRGPGNFDRLIRNLEDLDKKTRASLHRPPGRTLLTTLSQANVHEMPDIIRLASRLGFTNVGFQFQIFFDEVHFLRESLYFTPSLYDRHLREATTAASVHDIAIQHPDMFEESISDAARQRPRLWRYRDKANRLRCGQIEQMCYLKFDGQVEACCSPDRNRIGNIHENDFLDIWHGHHYRRLRSSFFSGNILSRCENCHLLQSDDVGNAKSHYIRVCRYDGESSRLAQPYQIGSLDREYRDIYLSVTTGRNPIEESIARLHELLFIDDMLHEVINALGVLWACLGDTEKAAAFFRKAFQLRPDDPKISDNYNRVCGEITQQSIDGSV
ncbi:radical SAM protein [Thiocapsa bogorovii]|uniref:radical SAM protein n=1 Tax=Thiocapsa bogorovii TaxID=521689 RepID=UPI001E5542F0|nr:radical SAM protein [Thiocapsa bogorovii]UHD14878.1 radical SAM protein [Thiocapsa bogorovii]